MNYSGVLKFRGTWRNYQARVLKNVQKYEKDNRIHIVAAPGSGKTTLGIELMIRMSQPALVLAPSITIREQWVARMIEAFLCDGVAAEEYLSQDIKQPKAITVITYQSLHSAMTRYRGSITEGEEGEENAKEEVDYSGFDIIETVRAAGIRVLCLDECHHLRSEWWKALEDFRQQLGAVKIIALTATPPYDSTPALWNRYMDMCGEIDEEITIPELVKEGSLCPHQDFVYFNYPTDEEAEEVERFEQRSARMQQLLLEDTAFQTAICSHSALTDESESGKLTETPQYFSAMLTYLEEKRIAIPAHLKRFWRLKQFSKMDAAKLECLLQKFLYEDTDSYSGGEEYREQLEASLKAEGLIQRRRVSLTANEAVEKLLISSKGKSKSILKIVEAESASMGNELRMLILTDYIRKEYEKAIGDAQADVNALGVLPFFEQLRRGIDGRNGLRLGVLCGTIVIIPAEAKTMLEEAVGDSGKVTFSAVGNLGEDEYLKVGAVGDSHFLTGAVTDIFTKGAMQVLIGTKSLLGEGWDSPCINSLILASFVGSFMLSNQMRGRAIRVFKEQPLKSSNIWHLVCLKPWKDTFVDGIGEISEDFALLQRRMQHFLGLHYTEDTIENGMERLSVIRAPYNEENVAQINRQMLELAEQRETLRERWERSLAKYSTMSVVEETTVEDSRVTEGTYQTKLKKTIAFGAAGGALLLAGALLPVGGFLAGAAGVASLVTAAVRMPGLLSQNTPKKRLLACGNGIKRALSEQKLLEDAGAKVEVLDRKGQHSLCLKGESGRDQEVFAQCVREFFGEVDDPRYLLVKAKEHQGQDGFYCVPDCFARRKEDAEKFYTCMKPYIGDYELIYTRNDRGKEFLLEGRMRALSDGGAKCESHKRVTE